MEMEERQITGTGASKEKVIKKKGKKRKKNCSSSANLQNGGLLRAPKLRREIPLQPKWEIATQLSQVQFSELHCVGKLRSGLGFRVARGGEGG